MASEENINNSIGAEVGSIGPTSLSLTIIADPEAAMLSDFVCGANETGKHLTGANWDRDATYNEVFDCRNIVEGDTSPDGKGTLIIKRGIEVGHIFQLGDKYAKAMKANVLGDNGKAQTLTMGCYGIGVSRIVAAAIEQNHDDYGVVWPKNIAPFQVAIVPMNMKKSERVKVLAESIYQQLKDDNIEVIFDDRKERPGVMFADMELMGIPHRIVISERGIDAGTIEYKHRRDNNKEDLSIETIIETLKSKLT